MSGLPTNSKTKIHNKRIYTRVRHDFKYWFIGGGYTKLYNINLDDLRAFFERGPVVGIMVTIKVLIWNIEIYFYKQMTEIMKQGARATIRFKPLEQSGQDKKINKACDKNMSGFRKSYGVDSDPGTTRKILSEQDKDNIIESVRRGG